jgi:hypothetical protein
MHHFFAITTCKHSKQNLLTLYFVCNFFCIYVFISYELFYFKNCLTVVFEVNEDSFLKQMWDSAKCMLIIRFKYSLKKFMDVMFGIWKFLAFYHCFVWSKSFLHSYESRMSMSASIENRLMQKSKFPWFLLEIFVFVDGISVN